MAMVMLPLTVMSVWAEEAPQGGSMGMPCHTASIFGIYDQTRQEVAGQMLANATAAFAQNPVWPQNRYMIWTTSS